LFVRPVAVGDQMGFVESWRGVRSRFSRCGRPARKRSGSGSPLDVFEELLSEPEIRPRGRDHELERGEDGASERCERETKIEAVL
jgi:hypothetical protein